MAEGSDELASKAFGVIPHLFFDIIARVIPGLLLLFEANCVSHGKAIKAILEAIFPDPKLRESPVAWLVALGAAGYVLGHAMSPIVKLLDRPNREIAKKYNFLRLHYPGVTAIAMRIRAEYIMYGGFAVTQIIILIMIGLNLRCG